MTTSLRGQTVIITGGGTGIGRVTARLFAQEGADVLIAGRTVATLKETAEGHDRIEVVEADVAEPGAPERIVAAALDAFGRVDVLVNNAAITRPAALGAIDREAAEQQVATNLIGPAMLAQEALPHLEATRGTIVNITSNGPQRGWANNSVYGATKVGLDFLTYTWAVELAPRGIRVVSVAPGVTATPVLVHAGFTPEEITRWGGELTARIPLGRIARPEEIGWWIVNVARPEAAYLTGTVLRVDGGINAA
ncbi:SDR family NAD(P)-dependent oxidoreductase [Nonomuraea insulae]|uniref:SDR family NAD(P)-dependent oxidoreductase n=1 Tax=Nonomuraea insulae TaxID=1616787 RepID=A0ABW1D9F3_9ACTN